MGYMERPIDIAIVGAGAAGLTAAIWAGRTARAEGMPLRIVLLDTRPKIGAKILMSGGTRCNVTNKEVRPSDYQGGPQHFIRHLLKAFRPSETLDFFKEIGVELILEPTGKYFPATHKAQTVLNALINEVRCVGVERRERVRIVSVERGDKVFSLLQEQGPALSARKVVLATGGLSYPGTGSDGSGYTFAKHLGHTVNPTFPALTPLLTNDADWKSLSGIALEVRLSFYKSGRKQCSCRDALLMTHFGFSGPAALDISRHYASTPKTENPRVHARFLPDHDETTLKATLEDLRRRNQKKHIKNILAGEFSLPQRLVTVLMKKMGMNQDETIGACSAEGRRRVMSVLLDYPLEIAGVFGYTKAEVTAGGVDLSEVRVQTMESKKAEGLYFAGEILDVDGRIGGFNFQWAWSSGAVAGRAAAKSLLEGA
jgi:predicted Rossmann fold flavoprotein